MAAPQPRRPCGPPRNDKRFLSFRGAERRGNPSFFTMDGGSGRRGRRPLRKVYRSPSNGPMWASAPTEKAQSTTQASRRAAKRPRPRPRGTGGNRRKDHPKRGSPPRLPGQRLAKQKARKEQLVKFDFCPMTSECSTAYNVRKFQQGPARVLVGAALIGQDGLGPRPVVQEDAERPGCTTRTRFFF